MNDVIWSRSTPTKTVMTSAMIPSISAATTRTAQPRLTLRRMRNSTIGFSPTARNADTRISSSTDAASLTARTSATASATPIVIQNPR